MAIAKVVEILAQSEVGWEEAAKEAVMEAKKTIRNIQSVYIKDLQAVVENDRIVEYRINAKITFLVDEHRS